MGWKTEPGAVEKLEEAARNLWRAGNCGELGAVRVHSGFDFDECYPKPDASPFLPRYGLGIDGDFLWARMATSNQEKTGIFYEARV